MNWVAGCVCGKDSIPFYLIIVYIILKRLIQCFRLRDKIFLCQALFKELKLFGINVVSD